MVRPKLDPASSSGGPSSKGFWKSAAGAEQSQKTLRGLEKRPDRRGRGELRVWSWSDSWAGRGVHAPSRGETAGADGLLSAAETGRTRPKGRTLGLGKLQGERRQQLLPVRGLTPQRQLPREVGESQPGWRMLSGGCFRQTQVTGLSAGELGEALCSGSSGGQTGWANGASWP